MFGTIGVVLVLVLLTSGRGPAVTAVLGGVLAVVVGVRLARTLSLNAGSAVAGPARDALAAVPLASPGSATAPPPATGDDLATALQVRWWRRDGHDRLYVSDASGRSLGWLERDTGRLHVLDEADRLAVGQALRLRREWVSAGVDVPPA